jgi:signal transduction histidine kinase
MQGPLGNDERARDDHVGPGTPVMDGTGSAPAVAPDPGRLMMPYGSPTLDAKAVELLSHELRSPITTIHLGAKVLRSPNVTTPVRDAVVEAVDVEAVRLLRVVEDLLAIVRHDAGGNSLRVEPVLLQHRLRELVWSDSSVDHDVRFAIPAGLPAVLADEEALGHALRNLLANAATHGDGAAPTEVVVGVVPRGVEICVLDRGPGIGADADRLFDPFYRSSRVAATAGAGLGLAAARRLTRAMGGELEASDRDGGGAAFTMRLPFAETDAPA